LLPFTAYMSIGLPMIAGLVPSGLPFTNSITFLLICLLFTLLVHAIKWYWLIYWLIDLLIDWLIEIGSTLNHIVSLQDSVFNYTNHPCARITHAGAFHKPQYELIDGGPVNHQAQPRFRWNQSDHGTLPSDETGCWSWTGNGLESLWRCEDQRRKGTFSCASVLHTTAV